MGSVFVTGIAGFTGHYLAARLRAAGYDVHGLSRPGDVSREVPGVTLHAGALEDGDLLAGIFRSLQPTYVVHLAAIAHVVHQNPVEMYHTNILGTRSLLASILAAQCNPCAVLLASSGNVYGNASAGLIAESLAPRPANDYGVTKAAMELVASLYRDRLPLIVTRPFNYTGVGQSSSFLIPKIVDYARRRAAVLDLGNVDVARDFSDVRMVVDAYARLLACPAARGETVNICSNRATTLREIVETVEKLAGHQFEIRVNPALVRSDEVKTLFGSKQKVESLIGPMTVPTLEETLDWMLHA